MDAAPRAVGYGKDAGLLDRTIAADLETSRLGDDDRAGLAGTDLVISTGCVGYVSEKTLCQIADASEGRAWMAHFVLRMFPYDKVRAALAERGYVTARGSHTYRQRRFASAEEKAEVMNRLVALGIDPSGRESEGWLHADLYVSRPVEDSRKLSCRDLLPA
jgi:carnitine O-acetyltransferase